MGRAGKAPTPTSLRLLRGARERDVNPSEPVAPLGELEAPDGVTPEVRAIFERVAGHLRDMRIDSPADVDTLVAYCEAVDKHRKASRVLAESPILVRGITGQLVRNPALAVQRDQANLIRKLAQEFGLTPSARTRIEVDRESVGRRDRNPFAGLG